MLHGDRPSAARCCALKAVTQLGVGVHGEEQTYYLTVEMQYIFQCAVGKKRLAAPIKMIGKSIDEKEKICYNTGKYYYVWRG